MEEGNSALRGIVGTFEQLKRYADFDADPSSGITDEEIQHGSDGASSEGENGGGSVRDQPAARPALQFGYTININLPDSNDITVFNAIFKSMKEHLL